MALANRVWQPSRPQGRGDQALIVEALPQAGHGLLFGAQDPTFLNIIAKRMRLSCVREVRG
jgi:hypothetical protein